MKKEETTSESEKLKNLKGIEDFVFFKLHSTLKLKCSGCRLADELNFTVWSISAIFVFANNCEEEALVAVAHG